MPALAAKTMPKFYSLTVPEYLALEAEHQGICYHCDQWMSEVEPGAARAKCHSCGQKGVFGVEQALLLGFIRIKR